ncbi:MAG: hypothetical protein AAB394_02310 [Patescibacteria group bacterium]
MANKLKTKNLKLKTEGGYAAMFSFLIMIIVLGSLVSVFTILVLKGIFLARTSVAEFKNIYAIEGFIEDTLKRTRDTSLADTDDGEVLEIGDSIVAISVTSENAVKTYVFSAQIGNKYFGNETLAVDGAGASAKIKKWQDSQ